MEFDELNLDLPMIHEKRGMSFAQIRADQILLEFGIPAQMVELNEQRFPNIMEARQIKKILKELDDLNDRIQAKFEALNNSTQNYVQSINS